MKDPLSSLPAIQHLIEDGVEISVGPMEGLPCVAKAVDDSMCLAMLQRRSGGSLYVPLMRPDRAITVALDEGIIVDEIHGQTSP